MTTETIRETPATLVVPFVTRLRLVVDPIDAYERLLSKGQAHALLESADAAEGAVQRSLLVARAALRYELRGPRATITAVAPEGRELLRRLEPAFPTARSVDVDNLEIDVSQDASTTSSPEDTRDDEERLRDSAALATLRAFSRALEDRPQDREPTFGPGAVGVLGFDLVDRFEPLPPRRADPLDEPDALFFLATDTVTFLPQERVVEVVTRGLPWEAHGEVRARHDERCAFLESLPGSASPEARSDGSAAREYDIEEIAAATSDLDREAFEGIVTEALERISEGDVFQVVPSRALTIDSDARGIDVYRALRNRNPSPYLFHLHFGTGDALFGASPETFLKVEPDGASGRSHVEIKPIAGTARRGRRPDGSLDARLDDRLALALQLDTKEQAEHSMLIDLARNDIARIADPGTTRVVQQLQIEKFRSVQHLVSVVRGRLRKGLDALDAYRAAANPGTLTGAPKLRAMQRIREFEPTSRGFYGGACGYLLADGRFDTCIVIRSLREKHGRFHARVGAGVVADSVPANEWLETEAKSTSVRASIADAERQDVDSGSPRGEASTATHGGRVLVVDHEDSFVFNLVDEFRSRGCETRTIRSRISLAAFERTLADFDPDLVLLSPGPGHPEDAGVTPLWLATKPRRPVLGICLGHQAIARSCGAEIQRVERPMHGRTSRVRIEDSFADPLFPTEAAEVSVSVARYHSLVATDLPETLVPIATTADRERHVMALRHRELPWIGLQFHPESQLSPSGPDLLSRALELAQRHRNHESNLPFEVSR